MTRPHLVTALGQPPDFLRLVDHSRAPARRKMIAAQRMLSRQPGCGLEAKLLDLLVRFNRLDPDDEDGHREVLVAMEEAIEEAW